MTEPEPLARSDAVHVGPWAECRPCMRMVPLLKGNPIGDSLLGRPPVCPHCGTPLDVWSDVLRSLETFPSLAFVPLGPTKTLIPFELPRNEQIVIRLSDYGIPAGAHILDRSYNGRDNTRIYALELHGGSPTAKRPDGTVRLYGATYSDEDIGAKTSRQLLAVTWVPQGKDVQGWASIARAFRAFAAKDFLGIVIPANTAVELIADRVTTQFLDLIPGASKENVSSVRKDLTYHHRLNVLVPMLSWLSDCPPMDHALKGDLNTLKKLRNQVGHSGNTREPITAKEAARLIRACTFGFHYMHILELHLNAFLTKKSMPPALQTFSHKPNFGRKRATRLSRHVRTWKQSRR